MSVWHCQCGWSGQGDHSHEVANMGRQIRLLKQSDLLRCPHVILMPEHYRLSGQCRCDDRTHVEMREWGYKWKRGAWR